MAQALFVNRDRVRVEGSEVTHLRTGRRVPIIGPPATTLVRTVLKDLREVAGEKIDLGTQANPPVAGCKFANVSVLADVAQRLEEMRKLPVCKGEPDATARSKFFASMDGNGNGFLSLAEIDGGLRKLLSAPTMAAGGRPALQRAFSAAKSVRQKGQQAGGAPGSPKLADDMVERGDEFRLLLLYFRRYLELFAAFEQIDTSGDRRLDREEFEAACASGLLAEWGVAVEVATPRGSNPQIRFTLGCLLLAFHTPLLSHVRPSSARVGRTPPLNLRGLTSTRAASCYSTSLLTGYSAQRCQTADLLS